MSILTSLTLPLAASTARSSAGPSVLQGPHQVAQKSTITGCSREASMTSLAKPASLPSLIRSSLVRPPPVVSPIRDIRPPPSVSAPKMGPDAAYRNAAADLARGLEIDDQGFNADRRQKAPEIRLRYGGRRGVRQRMEVHRGT